MHDFYGCLSNGKVAEIEYYHDSYHVAIYDIQPRPFKYDTVKVSQVALHVFNSLESALDSLKWHGLIWFKDTESEDLIDAATRLVCCEVV